MKVSASVSNIEEVIPMSDKKKQHADRVDDTLQELGSHGSFEMPVETYMDNCEIFHSLYSHWHNEMELICIEQGCGLVRLNKETLRVKKGDILIVNCGVLHEMRTDPKQILYYKSIVFDLSFLAAPHGDLCQERVISLLIENKAEFVHLISPKSADYEEIFRLFYRIHDCHRLKKPYYYVQLKSLFFEFFYVMLKGNYIIPADREENKNLVSIRKVLDYINLHYQENLSARELTRLSNYSEYYFMKLFRQYTGKTLISYINDLRLEKAKPLLLHSDASITAIAIETGFGNSSYFIKKFRQANGISPYQFRKNMT